MMHVNNTVIQFIMKFSFLPIIQTKTKDSSKFNSKIKNANANVRYDRLNVFPNKDQHQPQVPTNSQPQ